MGEQLFHDMESPVILRLVCLRVDDQQACQWNQKPCQQNLLLLGGYQAQYNRLYHQDRSVMVLSRLFQPFLHSLLGLTMSECITITNSLFPSGNTFQYLNPLL